MSIFDSEIITFADGGDGIQERCYLHVISQESQGIVAYSGATNPPRVCRVQMRTRDAQLSAILQLPGVRFSARGANWEAVEVVRNEVVPGLRQAYIELIAREVA